MDSINKIKTALGITATFSDPDVKKATYLMLDALAEELDTAGYDPGSVADECLANLEEAIEDIQEQKMIDAEIAEDEKVAADIAAEEALSVEENDLEEEDDEVDEDLALEEEIEDITEDKTEETEETK